MWIPGVTSILVGDIFRSDKGVGAAISRMTYIQEHEGAGETRYQYANYTNHDVFTLQQVVIARNIYSVKNPDILLTKAAPKSPDEILSAQFYGRSE